jgi:hypothetical protein
MVVSYSQGAPLTEALAKTFDGKHPCALCKQIAKGKATEKQSEFPPAGKKFEFSYAAVDFVFRAPTHYWTVRGLDERANPLNHAPPVPPPKTSCG